MNVIIKDFEYYLPENAVTNEFLQSENPEWDMHNVKERAGVFKRFIASENETALDLGLRACEKLFANKEEEKDKIDGIIFCTQSEDYIMPPNSCILHGKLKLPDNVLAFDFNLACSGYTYGLAIARGLITAGTCKNILLVNSDTYSKFINKKDRSARVLFGDGAAASIISASDNDSGTIIDVLCATEGKQHDKFMIPAGGCRIPVSNKTKVTETDSSGNVRSQENIHMDGMGILVFINSKVPKQIREILKRNNLTVDDISLFVFHQASKMALDSLAKILKIKSDRVYENIGKVGNTVSASIPIALKDALQQKRIKKGDKVLLSGFGVGLSWASAIVQF